MAPAPQDSDVSASLTKLSINDPKNPQKQSKKKSKKVVADSWEDEDLSESEPEPEPASNTDQKDGSDDTGPPTPKQPVAPPPTPLSPAGTAWPPFLDTAPGSGAAEASRRPEKTDAVARRMIAASLGLKAPKQTEEQRAYQKSIREQEKKRREQEKAAEQKAREDTEKAKAAVWDD